MFVLLFCYRSGFCSVLFLIALPLIAAPWVRFIPCVPQTLVVVVVVVVVMMVWLVLILIHFLFILFFFCIVSLGNNNPLMLNSTMQIFLSRQRLSCTRCCARVCCGTPDQSVCQSISIYIYPYTHSYRYCMIRTIGVVVSARNEMSAY